MHLIMHHHYVISSFCR